MIKHIDYRKDCPKCNGFGAYYMTGSDYEEPIQCICNMYSNEEWKAIKQEWISNGWKENP